MKATFFSKPLEWNVETQGESWQQGDSVKGSLRLKNHGEGPVELENMGISLALAEIKKVQSRAEGALRPLLQEALTGKLEAGAETALEFTFPLSTNGPVTDKKSSYYLAFGKNFTEGQLQLKVEPKALFSRIVNLLDTFHRFKVKEYKTSKKGVEFKLIPPTAREMANIESLNLTFSMEEELLKMQYDFQVKRLDTSSVTTKINKESVGLERTLTAREYSLGKDMINQDALLKSMEGVLAEVKMKAVF